MLRLLIFLVLIVLAYLVWRFVIRGDALVLARGRPALVSARLQSFVPATSMTIVFRSQPGRHRITEISLARSLGQSLGLQAPTGFVSEDLPLSRKEQDDPAMRAFVADYNRDNVRWVGSFDLAADAETGLEFPLSAAEPGAGTLRFTVRHGQGAGNSMSILQVAITSTDSPPVVVPGSPS